MGVDDKTSESKPALTYAPQPPTVSRRAFRVVLMLTILNTALLSIFIAGPMTKSAIVERWDAYQQRKADEAARVQREAAEKADAARAQAAKEAAAIAQAAQDKAIQDALQKCLTYTAPPDTLVYAEDPEGIAQIKARGGKELVFSPMPAGFPVPWPRPTAAADPPAFAGLPVQLPGDSNALYGPQFGVVFLHGREKGVGGPQRLVLVQITVEQQWRGSTFGLKPGEAIHLFDLATVRTIKGFWITLPTSGTAARADMVYHNSRWSAVETGALVIQAVDQNGNLQAPRIDTGGRIRLYAGQPDPLDPSKFTIACEVDGVHGELRGRLTQDFMEIKLPEMFEKLPWSEPSRDELIEVVRRRYAKMATTPPSTQPRSSTPSTRPATQSE